MHAQRSRLLIKIHMDRALQKHPEHQLLRACPHLHGVRWREEQLGVEVEEGGLGEAALVQAALVCAEHREAQQVCVAAHTSASLPMSLSSGLYCSYTLIVYFYKGKFRARALDSVQANAER